MKRGLYAAMVILLAPVLALGEIVVILHPDGSYSLHEVGSDTYTPVRVIRGDSTPPPTPPDPDDPQPPTDLSGKVQAWADEIGDPETAVWLGFTYDLVAKQIKSGLIPRDTRVIQLALDDLIEKAIDKTPSTQGKEDEWYEFHSTNITMELTLFVRSKAGNPTVDEWVSWLGQVKAGLDESAKAQMAAAGASEEDIDAIFEGIWEMFLKFLMPILLELLEKLLDDLLSGVAPQPAIDVASWMTDGRVTDGR